MNDWKSFGKMVAAERELELFRGPLQGESEGWYLVGVGLVTLKSRESILSEG